MSKVILNTEAFLTLEGHNIQEVTRCALQNKYQDTPLQCFHKHFYILQNKMTKTKKLHSEKNLAKGIDLNKCSNKFPIHGILLSILKEIHKFDIVDRSR